MKRLTPLFLLIFLLSTAYTALAQVGSFVVSAPDSIAGDYNFIALTTGWGIPANDICGDLVIMADTAGSTLGCNPNVADLTGKIAVVDRGTCNFAAKVLNAQDAGAIGVLIVNTAAGIVPGGIADGGIGSLINIGVAMISYADGLTLKATLTAGGTVTGCMTLPDVNVNFVVDLSNETVDPAGVYLGYNIEGQAAAAIPLTSLGNGLYGGTLTVPATTELAYVFVNGITQAGIEVVPAYCGADSIVGDSTGYARYIYAGLEGADAPKVCFGSCSVCQTIVTFLVDLRQQTVSPNGVHIAGNFQGYDPASTPLVDAGNDIYTYTLTAAPGDTLLYKFINGNTFNDDERAITAECGAPNGFGGFNRIYIVPNEDAIVLPAVCFDSCGLCPSADLVCDTAAIICDDLEPYTLGALGPQSDHWDTWDGTGGEGIVTNEQAFSGTQSLKIDFALPGTQQDVILLLGDSTSGNYLLKWKMYIPAGKKAYYNIQHDLTPHIYASDVFFDANGAGRVMVGTTALGTFHYQYDKWIDVKQYFDVTNKVTYLLVSDTLAGVWDFNLASDAMGAPTTNAQISGVDFFPIDATYKFYVDDVQFIKLAAGASSDFCVDATNINNLFGQPVGQVVNSGLFDNTSATTVGDPTTGYECFGEPDGNGTAPSLDNSLWFTFTGDGGLYFIETGDCGSTNYINDGDTQLSIYSGTSCSALTSVLCSEDGPNATNTTYPAGDTLQTVAGRKYYMLVDGFNFQGALSAGEFCLKVKQLQPIVAINDPSFDQGIRLAPNPTNGVTNLMISLPEAADLTIRVTNSLGQQLMQRTASNVQEGTIRLDMSRFAKGLYFVEMTDGTNRSTRRLIVE